MNILPFVFAFLLIFSLLSSSFLQKERFQRDLLTSLQGVWAVHRAVDNEVEKRVFASLKSKKKQEKKKVSQPRPYHSFREKHAFSQASKLSLFPLKGALSVQQKLFLQNAFKQLLITLYQNTEMEKELFKEGVLTSLMEKVFLAVANAEEGASLSSLEIADKKLQLLFYQLCKGTPSFAFKENGYPSLEYFVNLKDNSKSFSIHFNEASKEVLIAFFGLEIAQQIIEAEQKKWEKSNKQSPLTFAEFSEVIASHTYASYEGALFETLISFTKTPKEKKSIRVRDAKSGVFSEVNLLEKEEGFIFGKEEKGANKQ